MKDKKTGALCQIKGHQTGVRTECNRDPGLDPGPDIIFFSFDKKNIRGLVDKS